MNVTKHNFPHVITEIQHMIDDCDFIAIDLEFTGLFQLLTNDFLDNCEEFYAKSRINVNKFQVIQVGMSFFKMINGKEFNSNSYNFFIFPNRCRFLPRQEKERYFLSQVSSLTFLAENGFDFNKLIKEGISYLDLSQSKFVKEKFNDRNSESILITSEADKTFVDENIKLINEFINDNDKQELGLFTLMMFLF